MDILKKAKELQEKRKQKVNENISERIREEAEDTIKWIQRREFKGYTTKDSLREIEKSINNQKKYENS